MEISFLQAISAALKVPGRGRLHIPSMLAAAGGGAVGTTALQHFIYKAPARGQYVMPDFTAPLSVPELQQVITGSLLKSVSRSRMPASRPC